MTYCITGKGPCQCQPDGGDYCLHNSDIARLQADNKELRARVAELEHSVTELIQHYSETWDLPILERAEAARDGNWQAWLLCKQAEAVGDCARDHFDEWGDDLVKAWLINRAQHLHIEAEQIERGGSDEDNS